MVARSDVTAQHPLYAHHLKLRRAHEHLLELHKVIALFVEEQEPSLKEVFEERHDGWWYVVGCEPLPTTPYWGVIVGDFIHNLRSLLDQLVASLVRQRGEVRIRKHHKFPVMNHHNEWDQVVNGIGRDESTPPDPLRGVSEEGRAEIYWLQPFNGNDPLALVSSLSNTDKHRLVHTGSILSADEGPTGEIKVTDGSIQALTQVEYSSNMLLAAGSDEVVRVKLPDDFTLERAPYVTLTAFPVDVTFGEPGVTYGELRESYEWTANALRRIKETCF